MRKPKLTKCPWGYIWDILQQVNEVMTLFVMENELRSLKGRGHFPIPTITPHGAKIENSHQSRKTLEAVDEELVRIATTIRESESAYEKERGSQTTSKSCKIITKDRVQLPQLKFQHPIKNTGATENRHQPPERTTHFNPNPTHHFYPTTESTSHTNRYKPPVNDSIIQGAGTALGGQFTTGTTEATSHNEPWRNNGANAAPQYIFPPHMTTPTDRNGLFSDSPNSSNNRNGPTCFKCGEQGHMRHKCVNIVFCNHCKVSNHCNRTCRKLRKNVPSLTNSHIPTGYHPTATPPPLNAPNQAVHATTQLQPASTTNNGLWFQNYQDTNQPRTSPTFHTVPMNNMSLAPSANMTEAFTQLLTQVVNNKKDDGTKLMMKNIKTFDGTNSQMHHLAQPD